MPKAKKSRTPKQPAPDRATITATARLAASEAQRVASVALEAIQQRDAAPANVGEWSIDFNTDSGQVQLSQTLEMPFGSGGPGYDSPVYKLSAYDFPGSPRRFYIRLPKLPGADEELDALTASQLHETLDAMRTLCERAVSLGILPAPDTIDASAAQPRLRVARS